MVYPRLPSLLALSRVGGSRKRSSGIKIAPLDRHRSFDLACAVADSVRERGITLYTGDDDVVVQAFIPPNHCGRPEATRTVRIRSSMLGQWACWWTGRAVERYKRLLHIVDGADSVTPELLTLSAQIRSSSPASYGLVHRALFSHQLSPASGAPPFPGVGLEKSPYSSGFNVSTLRCVTLVPCAAVPYLSLTARSTRSRPASIASRTTSKSRPRTVSRSDPA